MVAVGDIKNNLFLYAVFVVILSVLLGVAEQRITERVQHRLFDPKVKVDYSRPTLFAEDEERATKASIMAEINAENPEPDNKVVDDSNNENKE